MTTAVVNYFESKNVRVMMSIGGFSYTKLWDKALGNNPTQLPTKPSGRLRIGSAGQSR
jgi:hypothetical protein